MVMKRKNLYAAVLLLLLSTVAFSNERARFNCRASGNAPCIGSTAGKITAATATVAESHVLLHTIINLLYI